jgi:virginiamycin B lyase
VACIQPVSYPAAPVSQAITRSSVHITPSNRFQLVIASTARLSQPQQQGQLAFYELDLGTPPIALVYGLIVGPDGSIWFADANGVVGNLAPDGSVTEYTLTGFPGSGGELTFGSDGSLWFLVTECKAAFDANGRGTGCSGQTFVGRLTPSGEYSQFAIQGAAPDQPRLPLPYYIGPAQGAAVWVTDQVNDRIVRIAPDGSEKNYQLPPMTAPTYLVQSQDGAEWFMTKQGLGRLTPAGSYSTIALNSSTNGFRGSSGDLAFAPDGSLWVTVTSCAGNWTVPPPGSGCRYGDSQGALQHWTTSGTLIESIPMKLEPTLISVGGDGTIWFAASKWLSPYSILEVLGEEKGGNLQLLEQPPDTAFHINPLAASSVSVWYSQPPGGLVSRYTP